MIAAILILLATVAALAFVGGVVVVSTWILVATMKATVNHR